VLEQVMACTIAGGPAAGEGRLRSLIEQTGADELMIDCRIHDRWRGSARMPYAAQALAELG
jgi:hypothetical protein